MMGLEVPNNMIRLGEPGHYQNDELDDWPVFRGSVHGDGLFVKDGLLVFVVIRIVYTRLDTILEGLEVPFQPAHFRRNLMVL